MTITEGARAESLDEALALERQQLIELLLREEAELARAQAGIRRQPRRDGMPASFAQQRLWFLDRVVPDPSVYMVSAAVRLRGQLDAAALEQCLNTIVGRHESLRTTFDLLDGQVVQVIAPAAPIRMRATSLEQLPCDERDAAVQQLAQAEARSAFDLARGPLLRATLLRLDEREHVLLLIQHHIITDAWSIGLFMQELSVCYPAYCAGTTPALPELPIQYADYAIWQREQLQGDGFQEQLAYWRRQMAGAGVLELPTDRRRPALQSFAGALHHFALSPRLTAALKRLSQREGVTLFMTLLGAFQALLMRYSGQQDIVVGSPVAGRTRDETEHLIGCFINTIVLRTNLAGDPTFRALLGRVRATALGAFAHQDLPFERLVEELQSQRDLSRNPLFQVMFALQNAPMPALTLPGLTLAPLPIDNQSAAFDLALNLEERAGALCGWFEYSTDLFDPATITRLVGHYQVMLASIVVDPALPLARLPLLTAAERRQLLVDWNAPAPLGSSLVCVAQLIAAQAAARPDAVAIAGAVCVSYSTLNARANQLAHQLRGLGVGPETLVGVCLPRSAELIIALLGVLKTGGAYLPLEPSYPPDRLSYMIDDAPVAVLLTVTTDDGRRTTDDGRVQPVVFRLSSFVGQVINMCADWPLIARQPTTNPPAATAPEHLAYVIYTSGSTGRPKGVLIPQCALVNHNTAVIERYALQPSDRVLQFASMGLDLTAEEVFPTLISGACLVPWPAATLVAPTDLLAFADRERLSVLNPPTPYWHELVAEMERAAFTWPAVVRLVVVGSEKALPERLAAWQRLVGDRVRWLNAYGPTETTITAMLYEPGLRAASTDSPAVPIGRPLANLHSYLLDANLELVPVGVPGEIYIGGVGLARGYLKRPDLTAERFVPNPFAMPEDDRRPTTDDRATDDQPCVPRPASCVRLYKTGDLARYLPDGTIDYLGRTDHQIKVRGFRIELAEIESVLGQHPSIREAAVLAHEASPGDMRLAAYVVPIEDEGRRMKDESAPSSSVLRPSSLVSELRDFLQKHLPAHMVPTSFVELDRLPRTPNGKVDRRALPAPAQLRPEHEPGYVAPQTALESAIARIWQAALRVERVGVHDNFFDLGGHSLLVIQIYSRLRELPELRDLDLAIVELFEHPTISALAKHIGRRHAQRPAQPDARLIEQVQAGQNRLKQRLAQRQRAEATDRGGSR
jgi:amino acid adenylation domain-containing protein